MAKGGYRDDQPAGRAATPPAAKSRGLEPAASGRSPRAGAAVDAAIRQIVGSFPDGIAIQAGGRLVFANAAFGRLLGYSPEELDQVEWSELVPHDQLRLLVKDVQDALVAPVRVLRHLLGKSGAVLRVEMLAFRVEWERTGAVAFVMRESARGPLDPGLRETDRMAALGLLAAGVAHEVNNPLAYVIANIAFAREHLAEVELDRSGLRSIAEALDEASQGIDRVRQVASSLKTFSRSEERVDLLDLGQLIESTIKMAKATIRHRAAIVKNVGPLPPVKGRATQLCQVFLNLLVNASDAISEDSREGRITLRAARTPAGQAVVEVVDTGTGIPPETLGRIFEPFFTTKPSGIGTGLGLAVCKNIVEEHEGTIEVQTRVGEGTLMRVTLPPAPTNFVPHISSAAISAVKPRRYRVLVIDDEPLVLNGMRRLLRAHEVTTATGGEAALDLLARRSDFDVILCDLMMPDVTGMDVHARLSKACPGLERKIVFVSGGAVTSRARELLERVPNLRVEKPLDPRRIGEILALAVEASHMPGS